MKNMFLGVVLSVLVGLPLLAALKVADKAPDFSARASLAGKEFNFSLPDALKRGPVVVYFYPSAFTKVAIWKLTPSRSRKISLMPQGLPSSAYRPTALPGSISSRLTPSIAPESFRLLPTRIARSQTPTI